MSYKSFHKLGDWLAICDICGHKFKASQLREQWDGLMVCKDDFSPRHPQDLVKAVKDDQSVEWTRSEATDSETDTSGWATPTSVPAGTFNNNL